MKVTCTLLAVAAGTIVLLADTAYAQTPTWCALLDGDEQQCNYYTQQECLETVSGVGGVCIMNPAAGSQQAAQPMQYPSSENAQGLFPLQLQNPGPPQTDFERVLVMSKCRVAIASVLVVFGFSVALAQQTIVIPDNLFTQAGFVVKYATTPEKTALLRSLPPDKLVTRKRDGRLYYVYADPERCNCAYVGTPEAYAAYRNWANIGPGGDGGSLNAMDAIDSYVPAPYVPANLGDSMDSILDPSF